MSKDHMPSDFARKSGYKSDLEVAETGPMMKSINISFGSSNHNAYIHRSYGTHEHFYYSPRMRKAGGTVITGRHGITTRKSRRKQIHTQIQKEEKHWTGTALLKVLKSTRQRLAVATKFPIMLQRMLALKPAERVESMTVGVNVETPALPLSVASSAIREALQMLIMEKDMDQADTTRLDTEKADAVPSEDKVPAVGMELVDRAVVDRDPADTEDTDYD